MSLTLLKIWNEPAGSSFSNNNNPHPGCSQRMNQSDILLSSEADDESDPDEDPGDIDGDLAEEQELPDIEDVPDESDDKMGMTFP